MWINEPRKTEDLVMMQCLAAVHFGPENVFVVRSEVGRMAVSMHMHNYLCVQQ